MITRRCVTLIPITPAIIKMVHRLATSNDGMPTGLKITNKTGQALYNSTWITGVDYNKEQFDDEDYDPNSSNTSDNESDDEQDNDDDDDDDMFDEMDPDKIGALGEPTTQDHENNSDESVKEYSIEDYDENQEPPEEEEPQEEGKPQELQDTNPTTAEEQSIPENA